MNGKTKRRARCVETHRLRLLLTVAARQETGDPIPGINWFAANAEQTVRELIYDGLLTNGRNIRLTPSGRRFIAERIHSAQGEHHKPKVGTYKNTQHQPEQPPHDGTITQTPQPSAPWYTNDGKIWRCHGTVFVDAFRVTRQR
jgi:hypothetical protein